MQNAVYNSGGIVCCGRVPRGRLWKDHETRQAGNGNVYNNGVPIDLCWDDEKIMWRLPLVLQETAQLACASFLRKGCLADVELHHFLWQTSDCYSATAGFHSFPELTTLRLK